MRSASPIGRAAPWIPWQRPNEPPPAVLRLMMFAVFAIPLVKPRLPGNSGPADLVMVAASVVVFLWVASQGRRATAPFAAATAVMMTAGAISGLVAGRAGPTLLVMVQELHLLLFCAAIATVARTPRAMEAIRSAWVTAGVAWGLLLIAAVTFGIDPLVNAATDRGTRAHLLFQNPNITGNYFLVAIFVASAARPPSWPRRIAAIAVMLLAMLLTGSNAAIVGLVAGSIVAVVIWLWTRLDPAHALLALSVTMAIGAVGYTGLSDVLRTASESEQPIIRYSIGRLERSAENRGDLFQSQLDLYRERGILGIGPFATRDVLGESGESGVRSSHNDYLATLIERGPLGIAGLIMFIGAIAWRLPLGRARVVDRSWRRSAGSGAALIGIAVAMAISATTHEVLHYRHLWALLGLLAAVHRWSRPGAEGAST